MQYYIRVDNRNVYVSEEIHKLYCKGERKERYSRESDIHNKTFYCNILDTEDLNGCDLFQDTRSKPVNEQAEEPLEHSLLFETIKDLEPEEKDIIRRIYCYDQSLCQISRETGVPVTTLHYRYGKILRKLRSLMGWRKGAAQILTSILTKGPPVLTFRYLYTYLLALDGPSYPFLSEHTFCLSDESYNHLIIAFTRDKGEIWFEYRYIS